MSEWVATVSVRKVGRNVSWWVELTNGPGRIVTDFGPFRRGVCRPRRMSRRIGRAIEDARAQVAPHPVRVEWDYPNLAKESRD